MTTPMVRSPGIYAAAGLLGGRVRKINVGRRYGEDDVWCLDVPVTELEIFCFS